MMAIDGPDLIEIVSCGLHVLHGAYGTAQKSYRLEFRYVVESNLFNFQTFTSTKLMNY